MVSNGQRRTSRGLGSAVSASAACRTRLGCRLPNQEDAMNQSEKAKRFAELHVKGTPLLLYNAWDAGSAKPPAGATGRRRPMHMTGQRTPMGRARVLAMGENG